MDRSPTLGVMRWEFMSFARWLHPGWWKYVSFDAGRGRKMLHAEAAVQGKFKRARKKREMAVMVLVTVEK